MENSFLHIRRKQEAWSAFAFIENSFLLVDTNYRGFHGNRRITNLNVQRITQLL